jgi:hypothetical protein
VLQLLPATAQAVEQLAVFGDDTLGDRLDHVAGLVLGIVPAAALSIWFVDEDLTFTMVAGADAAHPEGDERPDVRMKSSLTLHVAARTRLTAIITIYSRHARAFTSRVSWIEHAVGAVPASSVLDADLEFRSRRQSELAPTQVRTRQTLDMAVGVLMAQGLDLDEAEGWLVRRARLAALTPFEVARRILDQTGER